MTELQRANEEIRRLRSEVRRLMGWLRWIAWQATKLPDGASDGFRTMAHFIENQAKDALHGYRPPKVSR